MWTIVVIGVGTVFLALVSLMVVLEIFRLVFVPRKAAVASAANSTTSTAAAEKPNTDRAELVAAISAAIAAFQAGSGQKDGSFRIVEIIKSGVSTPAWSSQDRTRKHPRGVSSN